MTSLRLVQITDLHFGEQPGDLLGAGINTDVTFARVARRIHQLQPDWIVATGDLAQDPEPEAYRRLAGVFAGLPAPVHALPGNHDAPGLLLRHLGPEQGGQRRVVRGNWQLLLLDSTHQTHSHKGRLGPAELGWLQRTLENTAEYHTLICLHHHPLAVGSAWMDRIGLQDASQLFDCMMGHSRIQGVLFGHVHQTVELEHQGVRLFGSPSTCLQFSPRREQMAIDSLPPGLRYFDLHGDGRLNTRVEYLYPEQEEN
jgi:Icc protein